MGVNTKGIVATPCKDVFFVTALVERSMNALIRKAAKDDGLRFRLSTPDSPYRSCDTTLDSCGELLSTTFRYKGEQRRLLTLFSCDCDHKDIALQSLSLMLDCAGRSDLFMKTVLRPLSVLGPVYYQECDSIGSPELLPGEPMTYIQAYREGLVSPYDRPFHHWFKVMEECNQHRSASPAQIKQFFGLPVETVLELKECKLSFHEWDKRLAELAKTYSPVEPLVANG